MSDKEKGEKLYFSAIRRDKNKGILMRNAETRAEKWIEWESVDVYFIKETPNLFYWNTNNPQEDEINALRDEMNTDLAKILTTYLLLRKDKQNLSYMSLFGGQTQDFMSKYGVSMFEFTQMFQTMFKTMFGQMPSSSEDGLLSFVGE